MLGAGQRWQWRRVEHVGAGDRRFGARCHMFGAGERWRRVEHVGAGDRRFGAWCLMFCAGERWQWRWVNHRGAGCWRFRARRPRFVGSFSSGVGGRRPRSTTSWVPLVGLAGVCWDPYSSFTADIAGTFSAAESGLTLVDFEDRLSLLVPSGSTAGLLLGAVIPTAWGSMEAADSKTS